MFVENIYSQTCVQRPALGLKKSGRCSEVVAIRRLKKIELPILIEFCDAGRISLNIVEVAEHYYFGTSYFK